MNRMTRTLTLLLAIATTISLEAKTLTFGDGADIDSNIAIQTVMAEPTSYLQGPITVKGEIVKVCKMRGCWVELAAGRDQPNLLIKVRDGDMVFPMSTIGRTAYATGKLTANELDVEQTRQFLAHRAVENKLTFDPTSVTTGMTLYRLTPTGVTIVD